MTTTQTTDLAPRMILKLTDFVVHFYPAADPAEEYLYCVVDRDADVVHETDDEAEAFAEAREQQAAVDEERAEEWMNTLKDEIIELVTDCEDEDRLALILAMLKRK